MNKIYKLKYDRRRNQLVAVSELTAGAGKEATGSVAGLCGLQGVSTFRRLMGTLTPLAVLTGLVIGMLPGLALANPDLPTGGQVVAGQGSISTSGNQMTIQQNTHGLVTNWNSFDIGKNHTVQFVQPDSSAVALNRVTGGHESQILGTLNANGQVMLVNPAGVMFGKGAKVNTAGLVASTKNIRTEDFMAGRYTFSGGSHPGAEVVNQGSLTTTKGGYIVLAADRVRNSGTITTPSGKTVLAAAEKVTLQLDNTGLASVSVNGSVVNALVENRGLIAATNGQVYLTARGKDMLLNTVVNNSGTVEARGLNQQGGNIVLDGGDSGVVSQSGMLLADSDTGRGGKITVQGKNIHLAADSRTSATGQAGGGEVYVGGGWQGNDSRIKNASKVVTDKTSVVDVSATGKGDGGTAVLWSDDYTNFRGSILAKGGAESGKGGRVETSSRGTLLAAGDVQAGKGGEWLLDPADITITSGNANTNVSETGKGTGSKLDEDTALTFSPSAATGSQVGADKITEKLNAGTNVTIKTTPAKEDDTGTGGNITVGADISVTGSNAVALTLEADGNISISNHNITSSSGKLDVSLLGAGSKTGMIKLDKAKIETHGGNITLGQLNHEDRRAAALAVNILNGSMLNTSVDSGTAGDITINAYQPNVNLSAPELINTVRNGGILLGVQSSTLKGGNITLTGTQKGALATQLPVFLNVATLNASGDITLTGNNSADSRASQLELRGTNSITATGDITVRNTKSNVLFSGGSTLNSTGGGVAVILNDGANGAKITFSNGANITANSDFRAGKESPVVTSADQKSVASGDALIELESNVKVTADNITLNGASSRASGDDSAWPILVRAASLNATHNISMTGVGNIDEGVYLFVDSSLKAQNVLLNGTSKTKNGVYLQATSLNVTGDINISGVTTSGGAGIMIAEGDSKVVNLTASGNITLNGTGSSGAGVDVVATTRKSVLNASALSVSGVTTSGTTGFRLRNVDLKGGIENGSNLTLSSAGSGVNTGNTLDTKLTYSNFLKLTQSGIENNTTISLVTSDNELLKTLGYEDSNKPTDWKADFGSLAEKFKSSVAGKTGLWNVQGLDGVCASVTGNISLTGVGSLVNGNLTAGSSLNLSSADGKALVLTNTNLTATGGNVSLSGDAVKLSGTKNGDSNLQTINASNGSVTVTANGNISGNALDVSNLSFISKDGVTLNGTSTRNGKDVNGVKLDGLINVTGGGSLDVNGTSTRVQNAESVRGIAAGSAQINVEGVMNLTGTVNGDANASATTQVVGLDLGSATLNANSANLTGVSTAKGFGFWMNSTLSGSLAKAGAVNLSASGSGEGVSNFIGSNVSSTVIKQLVDSHSGGIGGITQVQDANVFKDDLETSTDDDLNKDYNGWQLDFTGVNLEKTGNISIKGASFTNSHLTAGNDLSLETSTGSLLLSGTELNATKGNITLNSGGTGLLNLSGATLNASGAGGINLTTKAGLILDNTNLNATGGAVTVQNSADSVHANFDVKGKGNITAATDICISDTNGRLNLAGKSGTEKLLLDAQAGNVTLIGNNNGSWVGDALDLGNVTVTAKHAINISGSVNSNGIVWGVKFGSNSELKADDSIDITGTGNTWDESGAGVFFAGKAEAGNVLITGVGNNLYDNAGVVPGIYIANGSSITAKTGNLSLKGKQEVSDGVFVNDNAILSAGSGSINIEGNTGFVNKGVRLGKATLNASQANISGGGYYQSGGGFALQGTTLKGGIAAGANLSFMSAGNPSASNYIDANISLDNLKNITSQGINHNTQVIFNSSDDLLKNSFGKKDNSDSWDFDASQYLPRNTEKPGDFNLVLRNACVTVSGDINVTGLSFESGNLTAGNVSLNGAPGSSLTVTNTNLTATSGNVSLSADAVKLSGKNDKGNNSNTIEASKGSVTVTAKGNLSGVALDVSNMNFKSKDGVSLNGTHTQNGDGVNFGGVINVSGGGGLDANGTSTRVNNAGWVHGLRTGNAKINVDGVMNLTGTVNGEPGATANNQVVGLDLGSATLNATSANLNGVSTAKGFGFWMDTTLQGGLKDSNNLTLRSSGSSDGVKNFIGQHVDTSVVKNLVESNKAGLGSITEVSDTTLFKKELESATGDDLVKDYGNWQLDFSGVTLNKTGNISIKGASFSGSSLTAGKDLTLAGAAGKILALTNTVLTSTSGNISLSGDAVRLTGTNENGVNKNTLNASEGSVTVVAAGNVAGNSLDVANTSFTSKNGTTLDGTATQDGNGVNLAGSTRVSGTLNIDGQSKGKGNGLVLSSNLDVTGKVNIAGESAGGTGVTLNGNNNISTGGGHISGKSVSGAGVSDTGASNAVRITPQNGQPFTVSGESETGSGLLLSGTLANTDTSDKPAEVMFSGRSGSGYGVVVKNLTLSGLLGVEGSSTTGNGVAVSGKIAGDSREKNVITGTSAQGDGLVTQDVTEATRVTLIGRATNGVGIRVKGALKNDDSALDGQASGTGTGVALAGPVSGGAVTGFSQKGAGVTAGEGIKLDNVAVLGKTVDGVGVEFNGKPDMTGGTTVKGYASGSGRAFRNVGDDDHDDWSDIPSLPPDVPVVPDVSHPASPGQDKENSREDALLRELQEHILQAGDSRESLYRPGSLRDVVRPSGYRNQERPVSVDICTEGECRKLDVGLQDRPVR
ncbi:filamentous hemagglutinin N-terminal domain-containing protein [Salmonella enterica]|nr:filamentous hemagglutinin N-terminal domain-containing protein [Salmonella enterica]